MKLAAALATAFLCLSAAPQQDKAPKPVLTWAKSWDEAIAEATLRNVPIYFTVHKDG